MDLIPRGQGSALRPAVSDPPLKQPCSRFFALQENHLQPFCFKRPESTYDRSNKAEPLNRAHNQKLERAQPAAEPALLGDPPPRLHHLHEQPQINAPTVNAKRDGVHARREAVSERVQELFWLVARDDLHGERVQRRARVEDRLENLELNRGAAPEESEEGARRRIDHEELLERGQREAAQGGEAADVEAAEAREEDRWHDNEDSSRLASSRFGVRRRVASSTRSFDTARTL
ncbi:hypothetical protein FB451DRAFT_1270762, partial [Mycena latifolia]